MNFRSTLDAQIPANDLQQIDSICDRFEADWRAGLRPDLVSYLVEAPPGRKASLFRDLLNLELEYRLQNGELPDARTYDQRFPDFADIVDAAFAMQRGRGTDKRPRTVMDQIEGSTVVSLDLMQTGMQSLPSDEFTLGAPQGPAVAGYEILGELGQGGMGVVFKARQIALNRAVALKMIKSGGFASESELVRFQNEVEAVAQLDHPNIVPIFEVGQHGGRHFFSMKLIEIGRAHV